MIVDFSTLDWVAIGTCIATAVGALASLVAVLVSAKRTKQVAEALSDAKMRETYVICPNCKKKVPLSEITFHLPDGTIDNNLNGKPDYLE